MNTKLECHFDRKFRACLATRQRPSGHSERYGSTGTGPSGHVERSAAPRQIRVHCDRPGGTQAPEKSAPALSRPPPFVEETFQIVIGSISTDVGQVTNLTHEQFIPTLNDMSHDKAKLNSLLTVDSTGKTRGDTNACGHPFWVSQHCGISYQYHAHQFQRERHSRGASLSIMYCSTLNGPNKGGSKSHGY